MSIPITHINEVEMIAQRGLEPLMMFEHFDFSVKIYHQMVLKKFPSYSVGRNSRFYKWYWENYPIKEQNVHRQCEECGCDLINFSNYHVSHILPRGGYQDLAYFPVNINLLCTDHHDQWGDPHKKKSMKIYPSNLKRIDWLRDVYKTIIDPHRKP